jgi:hypothetical protein
MKKILGPILGAMLIASAPVSAAAAQPVAATQPDDAAKLAEAHAIINIMFPPGTRAQMMEKMMADLTGPIRQNMPLDGVTDPGLKALFKDYMDDLFAAERPVIIRHLPAMTDAMAVAYTHQYSLAELKDIHAFALSPSGNTYFSHVMTVVGDPAVRQVNADMIADAQQAAKASVVGFKDELVAYVKAHPDAAAQLQALGQAKTQGK